MYCQLSSLRSTERFLMWHGWRVCRYVVASAVVGTAGGLLQIPVAMYLLCKSKRAIPSAIILDISMHADIVSCYLP